MDVFLQTSATLKEQRFHDVALYYEGKIQYCLSRGDFKIIGNELGIQNVADIIQTFHEILRSKGGSKPFDFHLGVILHVMNS